MPDGDALRRIQSDIDATMRDIVANRSIPQSASMIPDQQRAEEPPRAVSAEMPITSPPGIDIIDKMVEAQDRKDRIAVIRQATENAFIESHFEKSPRVQTDYHPLSKETLDK